MIYYFTGTGNGEFVAKKLAKATGDETAAVYECIRDGEKLSTRQGEKLVFVTPTHCWRVPHIVEDWILNGELAEGCKAYFVLTCGSDIGNAEKYARELCDKAGFEFMGIGEVVMPENYVAMFDVPEADEAKEIVKLAVPVIEKYAECIASGEKIPAKRVNIFDSFKSGPVNPMFYGVCVKDKKFYATDACISCGKCASVCITHNIKLVDGKPQWQGNCIHCMRCICDCPESAIEYGRASKGKPRYHCP